LKVFDRYRQLEPHIISFIVAEFFLQLTNAAFFLVLNIYLSKSGFSDEGIAGFLSWRYLTVMILAYPLGRFVRHRPIKPVLYTSAVFFPIVSFSLVTAVSMGAEFWLYPLFMAWGATFFAVQSVAIPYILRNCREELHTEALALNFTAWSVAIMIAGGLNYFLSSINPEVFTEKVLLQGFAAIGLISIAFVYRIKEDVYDPDHKRMEGADWALIARALMPTIVIAVGAGLTIQFMNLFFYSVFNVDFDLFSLMGALTAIIASLAVLSVPRIKSHLGFRKAVPLTQGLAVLALIGLASTEYFKDLPGILGIAVFLYVIRQPLMNIANPMTSELVMSYVGSKNREMTAALNGAVWSGSWFLSSLVFAFLRRHNIPYSVIFYITAAMYSMGIFMFYQLILTYENRKISAHNKSI
jgi:MFS family permease